MDAEATLVDRDTRPDPRHQIILADNLARMLDQNNENIERAAAKAAATEAARRAHLELAQSYAALIQKG